MKPSVPPRVALISYRLGMADGVSVAAAQWVAALRHLGATVRTIAGAGTADLLVPELAIESRTEVRPDDLAAAVAGADVVIADNIASLPLNLSATEAVCRVMRGRRAILRHHDFPWERERFRAISWLPRTDPHWTHVTISEHARKNLLEFRGIDATTIYHGVQLERSTRRSELRSLLGIAPTDRVVLQPTRAITRKRVDLGLDLAHQLKCAYWLTGPAEEGFDDRLAAILASSAVRVLRGVPAGCSMADVYAASDLVTLPSEWEGFGLPLIESALARRPIAVSDIPVTAELRALGFRWIDIDDVALARREVMDPTPAALDHNEVLAKERFGPTALRTALAKILESGPAAVSPDLPKKESFAAQDGR